MRSSKQQKGREKMIIKCAFKNKNDDFNTAKTYSYLCDDIPDVAVGDLLVVNTAKGEATVQCVAVAVEDCGYPVEKLARIVGRKEVDDK